MIDTTLHVLTKKSFDLSNFSSSLSGVRYVILSCEKKHIDPGKIRLQISDCTETLFLCWNNRTHAEKFAKKFLEVLEKTIDALNNHKVLNRHYLLLTEGSVTKYLIHVSLSKNKNCQITIYKKFRKNIVGKSKPIIRFHSDFVTNFQYDHCDENIADFKYRILNLNIAIKAFLWDLNCLNSNYPIKIPRSLYKYD